MIDDPRTSTESLKLNVALLMLNAPFTASVPPSWLKIWLEPLIDNVLPAAMLKFLLFV